jgi:hypothetical protein
MSNNIAFYGNKNKELNDPDNNLASCPLQIVLVPKEIAHDTATAKNVSDTTKKKTKSPIVHKNFKMTKQVLQ